MRASRFFPIAFTLMVTPGLLALLTSLAPSQAQAGITGMTAAPAAGARPRMGARPGGARTGMGGTRAGVRAPHAGVRGIQQNPRTVDTRSQIVEGSLRDMNRSLEASRPPPVNLPRPADCPGCPTRADLSVEASPTESERALRGGLHRLRRETRIAQNPDERRNQAEDAVSDRP